MATLGTSNYLWIIPRSDDQDALFHPEEANRNVRATYTATGLEYSKAIGSIIMMGLTSCASDDSDLLYTIRVMVVVCSTDSAFNR